MLYTQQVLEVLVGDRRRAIVADRRYARRAGIRRLVASAVYAVAKAVTVVAVVLDDEPWISARERAR